MARRDVTTLQFRPTYMVGGLCTPPPPRFAGRYSNVLATRISQAEFDAQIDAMCGYLAEAHDNIRRARFVPLGLLLLGLVFCALMAVVAAGGERGRDTPLWPILAAIPLLAIGGIGLTIVYCRRQATMDACTERLRKHVTHLNNTSYLRLGLRWRVSSHSILRENGRPTIRLPLVELEVGPLHDMAAAAGEADEEAYGFGGVEPQANDMDDEADTAAMLRRNPMLDPAGPADPDLTLAGGSARSLGSGSPPV